MTVQHVHITHQLDKDVFETLKSAASNKKPASSKKLPDNIKPSFYQIIEENLNRADHIILLSIISGVVRIIFSIIQFFIAIVNSIKNKTSINENFYKHAGLNFIRGVIVMVPIFGTLLISKRDAQKVRCCYENEVSDPHTRRLFCVKNNEKNWLKWKSEHTNQENNNGGQQLQTLASAVLGIFIP